jgi:hypothetical protein
MSEQDGSIDDAAGSDLDQATRRLRYGRSPGGEASSSGQASQRRLRHFVDRLFDNTMPRIGEGEPAKRRDAGEPAQHRNAGEPATANRRPVAAQPVIRFRAAIATGGVLSWADSRLVPTVRRSPTPRVILQLFGLIILLSLLGFGTSSVAISQIRDTIRIIGLDAKPAIGAAERLRIALGAMDVDAASDSLLGDAVSTGTSREFAGNVADQITAMVQAGAGIGPDGTEAAARLQAMQYDLHLYYGALGEARDAGRSKPWIAAQRVKFASRLLRSHVMAQADALETGNQRQIEDAYAQSRQQSLMLAASYAGIGALLAAVLIGAQIFLLRRTRRLVNVPLALATVVLAAAILWVGLAILQERADLQAGMTDALARLTSLRQAKSAGYAINADQAMWLIDHEANRVDYEEDFDRHARLVLDVVPTDDAALAQLQAYYAAAVSAGPPPIAQGLLAGALDHAVRAGSGVAPTGEAIAAFLDFLRIDGRLRALEGKGDHRGALELRTGNKPGQSLFALARMDRALDAAIAIADGAFEQRIASATAIAGWLSIVTATALGLTLLLATTGLWQRYREYR